MLAKSELLDCPTPRKFYVKRKLMKQEYPNNTSSIFAPTNSQALDYSALFDDAKKYQTVTTTIDNTLTLHSQNEDTIQDEQLSQRISKNDHLPKIHLALNSKLQRNISQLPQYKQKTMSNHVSEPHYVRLQKTLLKRVSKRFGQYKKQWSEQWSRRKEKSVIERCMQKAAQSIEYINLDASKRQNTSDLSQMLRNNIADKTFVFPGKIRPDISGVKGKGGKVIPIFAEVFMIQEVYKHDKRKK